MDAAAGNPSYPEGSTLLHYRIKSRVGEGGMGVVYEAEDTRLGRTVALKVLRQDLALDEEWSQRFQREARAASSISHPGVATLYDYYREGPVAFFTMEFVEGRTLREVLSDGPVPLPRLLESLQQIADALAEAHRRGIVHRDLKPENVMEASSGFYKILDFGLARLEAESFSGPETGSDIMTQTAHSTQRGQVLGTITYMSPEQAQGLAVDARSDIFTFGSLAYELATGRPAFRRNNAIATFHAIVHEDPEPMGEAFAHLPADLERIVSGCLAKAPVDRYQSSADLAADIRSLRQTSESGPRPSYNYPPPARRRSALFWVAAASIVMVATAVSLLSLIGPSRPPAPELETAFVESAGSRYLAIATFSNNTGDNGLDWMSRGLPEMLTTELAGIPGLQVISTHRLNDLLEVAGRGEAELRQTPTATELARWAGAGIVVGGSLFGSRDNYRIDVQAYDTSTGQVLAAAKAEGTSILSMVPGLSDQLEQGLKLITTGRDRSPGLVTASQEAFQHYTEGMEHYTNLDYSGAGRLFEHAVEADPGFALAGMRLALSLYLDGRHQDGLDQLRVTAESKDLLAVREAALLETLLVLFTGDDREAVGEKVETFSSQFPQDQEARVWLARARADVDGNRIDALRLLRKVLAEEPHNLQAAAAMAEHLAALGRREEARSLLEDYRHRSPDAVGPLTERIERYGSIPG